MKRKLIAMSIAMIAGLPHAVSANGSNKQDVKQPLIALEELERSLYAVKWAVPPMRESLTIRHSNQRAPDPSSWRLDLGMPTVEAVGAPDVLPEQKVLTGISLWMKF